MRLEFGNKESIALMKASEKRNPLLQGEGEKHYQILQTVNKEEINEEEVDYISFNCICGSNLFIFECKKETCSSCQRSYNMRIVYCDESQRYIASVKLIK